MIYIHKADEASPNAGKYFMRYSDNDGSGPDIECPAPMQAALANAEKLAKDARDNAEEAAAQAKLADIQARRAAAGL